MAFSEKCVYFDDFDEFGNAINRGRNAYFLVCSSGLFGVLGIIPILFYPYYAIFCGWQSNKLKC